MDLPALIGVSLVCAMGAMSPGPSLAVVLRNTISGGRTQGVMTGIGHGIGLNSKHICIGWNKNGNFFMHV